jgi:hypothetical protein
MVPAFLPTPGIDGEPIGRKNVLPDPISRRVGVFAVQGARKEDGAAPASELLSMQFLDAGEMRLERTAKSLGQDRDPLAHSFALADRDLPIAEVDVFDPEAEALEETEPAPIEEMRHEAIVTF